MNKSSQNRTIERKDLPDVASVIQADYLKALPSVGSLWATVVPGRSPVTRVHLSDGIALNAFRSAEKSGYPGALLQRLDVDKGGFVTIAEFQRPFQDATVDDVLTREYGMKRLHDGRNTIWLYRDRLVVLHSAAARSTWSAGKIRILLGGTTVLSTSSIGRHSGYQGSQALDRIVERHARQINMAIQRIDSILDSSASI